MNKILFSFLLCGLLSIFQINQAFAMPITYAISGDLNLGLAGSSVPTSFLSAINNDVFGGWTGSLTYDVDTTFYQSDITSFPSGDLVGKKYSGGITAVEIELNDGTKLNSVGGELNVFSGSFLVDTGYELIAKFSVPDSFWLAGVPPSDLTFGSFISLSISGVEQARNILNLPPLKLDEVLSISAGGQLCGDFDSQHDIVNINCECVFLNSTENGSILASSAPVPEPSTFLLMGAGLLGLGWYGRKRKKA